MDQTVKLATVLLLGVLVASVYLFSYRLVSRTPNYPSYESYVPLVTLSDGTTIPEPSPNPSQTAAYDQALKDYSVETYTFDVWNYLGELLAVVLVACLAALLARWYPVLSAGLFFGLIFGYLATRGVVSFDSLTYLDEEVAQSRVTLIIKLLAAFGGFLMLGLADLLLIERSRKA